MIEEKKSNKAKKGVNFSQDTKDESKLNKPWMGSSQNLKDDEYLEFDNSAYEMLHRAHTEWYCYNDIKQLIKAFFV